MKLCKLLFSLLATVALFAAESPQNAGRVQFYLRSSSAFDIYTNASSASTEAWIRTHFWRFQTYSPYFDQKLSWMPDAWSYLDLYGILVHSPLAAQHPEWILHDSSGNRLYIQWGCSNGTCPNYAADITNSKFRAWWIANAQSQFAKGYKGFWIDDVNMDLRVSNGNGIAVAPHDSDTGATMTYDNWRRYVAEFVEDIRAALPTAEIVHNSIWYATPARYSDQYVIRQIKAADYINLERGISDHGLVGGTGPWSVKAFLDYVDAVHSYGKNIVLDELAYNGDYGLAGYYLFSNGDDVLGNQQATPKNWWAGYEVNLGAPQDARYDWKGLIRRDFIAGMVLLNPPKTTAITVSLPVPLTRIDNGSLITSVTLQPGQAVVLTGAVPIPDYALAAAPGTVPVASGGAATSTTTIAALRGFSGSVGLAASGLPYGASASFSPASINGSGSATVKFATSATTPSGTHPITIAGTSGSLRHTITVNLEVNTVHVNLAAVSSRAGVYTDGAVFSTGGIDSYGFAYSGNLLGTRKTLGGITYTFGAANALNTVTSSTIPLPAGTFSALHFVGTAVNGNQVSQKFTVTYTDGTVTSFVRSMSDWKTPVNYSGEVDAMTMPYRNTSTGAADKRTFHLYSYSFLVNKAKTIRSIVLPHNGDVVVLAVTLIK